MDAMRWLCMAAVAGSARHRECWKVVPQKGRLAENVGHQGEELTYRLVNAAMGQRGSPRAIWWPWRALRWSRELLNVTMPGVQLLAGDGAPEPTGCQRYESFKPVIKRPQWSSAANHEAMRRIAYAACGVSRRDQKVAIIRVLGRYDDDFTNPLRRRLELCGPNGKLERRIENLVAARDATQRAAQRAGVNAVFEIENISSKNPGNFCEQIRRFATADVVLSIHGAHLVNVPFLPPGGLLFEVLPWAHTYKQHHSRLLRRTDLHYDKLCGPRPADPRLPDSESFCEGRSPAARRCTAIVRDCYPTRIRDGTSDPLHCKAGLSISTSSKRRPCDCLIYFEKRLTSFLAARYEKLRAIRSA